MAATATPELLTLLNLEGQYSALRGEITAAIHRVMEAQQFILGPNVIALEKEIAQYCGVEHAVGVASGTDALLLSLRAAGVGPGDEVIVPAFSFIASADAVSLLHATPVFVDIDPETFNIDPGAALSRITSRTRAIIAVHLYGQPAEMAELRSITAHHGLALLEDSAQALGASYGDERVCSLSDFGCISFFPSKNLGACGDGGMVVTQDAQQADRLRKLRSHGSVRKYHSEEQGWNSRLDELQAAILRVKLPHLDTWNEARRRKAEAYHEVLSSIEELTVPRVATGRSSVFHQYTIRVPHRDYVQQMLADRGIQSAVYYPVPLHLQPMYKNLGYLRGDLPHAEAAAAQVLSLPIYPELSLAQIERVGNALREIVHSRSCSSSMT